MNRIYEILVLILLTKNSIGQNFNMIPPDYFKGPKAIEFRQVLPTNKGTVLLATSLSNLGEIDKMRISLTQPSYLMDKEGHRQTYKQPSILKDLYESFCGIKLLAEGPKGISYLVSDNNHIGLVNYPYGKYAIFPPFIFPPNNNTIEIKKIWINQQGDLYIGTGSDTIYIYKDATNVLASSSSETFRLNYDVELDTDSNIVIAKGAKKLTKLFLGKGVIPYSFAYNSDERSVWIGTNYGIYAYDPLTGQLINKVKPGSEGTLTVTDIDINKKSAYLWFSSLEKGMGRWSFFNDQAPKYFPYKRASSNNNILSPILNFCRKSNNEFFVAPYDSVPAVFNTETETYFFINDTIFNRTPNRTTEIELDASGGLYIVKGGGLFGSGSGKYSATLAGIMADSNFANVVIDEIQINGISYSELKDSHGNYELLKKISLKYNENKVLLFFRSRGFASQDTILFSYKLEGYDKTWIEAPYSMMDERLNMAQYSNLAPGSYVFKIRVKRGNEDWRKNQAALTIIIESPFWQTWWFWTAVIAGLAIIVGLILWWRIRVVKKREREKFAHEKQIMELEAKALRAQMNPHFIFNCLNSIKSLIQQNENEKSVAYLTTFSKLIRNLFNNGDKKEINLYDEIETCKLYLKLESMRFDAKFSYSVNIDDNIDLKSIQIPALIIQPFIENAIWHGIVPRNTGGKVSLNVLRKDGVIQVVIDDDGIGREASAQNKSESSLAHQSKGVNLTQTRLELNNLLQQRQAKLETIDKKDETGTATGTKIILTIKEEA